MCGLSDQNKTSCFSCLLGLRYLLYFLIAARQSFHFCPTFRPSNKIQTFSQLLTAHCKTCWCCQTGFWSICFVCFAWFVTAGLFMFFFPTAVILQSSLVLYLCWLHFHCRCFPGVRTYVCAVRIRDPLLLTFNLSTHLKAQMISLF